MSKTSKLPGGGPVVTSALQRGDLLAGRYRIERELGRGGMGAVYAAWDSLTEVAVAIKVVGGGVSELEHDRMRDEVKASMLLTHPSIARTHTMDEVDGETFIVMELLDGETLAARISRGALPRAEAIGVVVQLLRALEVAHAAGIVHRDVKPANIMCCTDGRVVLMDFGIARIDDHSTATHTTSIKGTPAYMAPEVVSGRRADARADVYAAGLILFEVLTGEPPFKAASVTVLLFDQLHTALDTARLDPAIARVLERATAKDPAARYASATELREALESPPPVAQPTPPPTERTARPRWPWLVGGLAVVAVASVISGLAWRDTEVTPPTPPAPTPAPGELTPPPPSSERAQHKALLLALLQLEGRACGCRDPACGAQLLPELAMVGDDLAQTSDPTARHELDPVATRITRCLVDAGVARSDVDTAIARTAR